MRCSAYSSAPWEGWCSAWQSRCSCSLCDLIEVGRRKKRTLWLRLLRATGQWGLVSVRASRSARFGRTAQMLGEFESRGQDAVSTATSYEPSVVLSAGRATERAPLGGHSRTLTHAALDSLASERPGDGRDRPSPSIRHASLV